MTPSKDDRERCPYVGLQPFEEADREFFFGRERDQQIIIANLLASPLTILYGSSGVGKSSVLMAGVVPQLRRERPRTPVVVFRNWVDRDFQLALTRACLEAVWTNEVDQPKPAESLPFDEILRACAEAAHETIVVILDQFEEYFLYHPKASAPESFEAQFARAVNRDDIDVGFLIALRDDSLSRLDRFQERIPNLLSNRLRLQHLDSAGAAVALRRPLEVWNAKYATGRPSICIEDSLVSAVIQQVRTGQVMAGRHGGSGVAHAGDAEEEYVEAPFLQLVMERLWDEERRVGSHILRRETLDRLQGAKAIVSAHLDDIMSQRDTTDQTVCASFFDHLVTPTGSKVACCREDLIQWAGDLAPRIPAVLKLLSEERILRTVAAPKEHSETTQYELYHDVYAPAILDWRHRYVEAQERARAIEQAREQAVQRARRRWIVALVAMTAIAIIGWVVATWQSWRFEADQKAAESIFTSSFDAARSLNLALEAVQATALFGLSPTRLAGLGLPPTAAAEDALRQAIQASRLEWTQRAGTGVYAVAFSSDGHKLATAGENKKVQIWDIATGHPKPLLVIPHNTRVRGVAFLPTGDRLVTIAHNTAYLWALDDPHKPLWSFLQGSPIYSAFAVSRDGSLLATASHGTPQESVIKVWDLKAPEPEPKPMTTIDVPDAWIMDLAFSPDGCCLAIACVERGTRTSTSSIWSIKTGEEILSLPMTVPSDAVAFTPDGKSLVTASRDAWVRVWQPAGNAADDALDRLLAQKSEPIASGDAALPAAALAVVRWSERIFAGHSERIRNIAVSQDGTRIASAGGDNTVKIWDTKTGENLLTLTGHTGYAEAVQFSPDGRHVVTASRDRTIKFWNIEVHTNTVTSIAFSPNGKLLATGSSDRTARLWELSGDTPLLRYPILEGHTEQIYRLAFNPTNTLLATAGFDNMVKLWDVDSGNEIATLKQHVDQLRSVAFSPDSTRLASAGADGVTWLYDLRIRDIEATALRLVHNSERTSDGKLKHQASALAFHPQRAHLATGGWDGKLQLWDFSGQNVGALDLPRGSESARRVLAIAFSPDGAIIAALTRHWVHLWPVTAFDRSQTAPETITIEGVGYCNSMAYRRDSKLLAVACNNARVYLYDMIKRTLVKTITVHKNAVQDVAFSPNGTMLATASLDKTFHVSPLSFKALYEKATRLQAATSGENP
jgi:WD40 repeat protein